MIYLYLVLLVAIFVAAYVIKQRDFMSPWVLSCLAFIVSTLLAAAQNNTWGIIYSPLAIVVISTALLTWGAGDIIGAVLCPNKQSKLKHQVYHRKEAFLLEIRIGKIWYVIILIFIIVSTYFLYKEVYRISVIAGNRASLTELSPMLYYARIAMTYSTKYITVAQMNPVVVQMQDISQAFAAFCLFVLIFNTIYYGFKARNLKYIIIVIIYAIQTILSTGRLLIFELLILTFALTILLMKNKLGWSKNFGSKFLKYVLITIASFSVLFYLMGFLSGKSAGVNFWNNICWYGGGSIPGFDIYLHNPPLPDSSHFGSETLIPLYNVLNKLGLTHYYSTVHLEFLAIGGYPVNIYTSLRRYIQDYSFFGMYVIQFFLGMFYSVCYNALQRTQKDNVFKILVYSSILFPVVMQSLDEEFLMGLVSAPFVFQLIYLSIIYYWFVTKKKEKLSRRKSVYASLL